MLLGGLWNVDPEPKTAQWEIAWEGHLGKWLE